MPPRHATVNTAGTGLQGWYTSLPIITRVYATALFAVTAGFALGFVPPMWIALGWHWVIPKFEVWRLVTNFFFMGKFSFNWIIKMLWLLTYGATLESQTYQFDPAEYALLFLFGMGSTVGVSALLYLTIGWQEFYFNADTLIFMLLYVWSRHFPEVQVSIYGLFKVLSFYVPFVFAGLEFMLSNGRIPWSSLLGIVIGHMHYYLTVLYPAIGGPRMLQPPRFLRNLLADWGIGTRVNTHAATGVNSFQSFRGRGMRLGTQ